MRLRSKARQSKSVGFEPESSDSKLTGYPTVLLFYSSESFESCFTIPHKTLRAIFEALKSDAKKTRSNFFLLSAEVKWVKWGSYSAKALHIFLLLFI